MVKKPRTITIEEDLWGDWSTFVTRKYGSGRKLSQAVEDAINHFMDRSKFDELDEIVLKQGKDSGDLDELEYDFEAAVAVMDNIESYLSTYRDIEKRVEDLGSKILESTQNYNPSADTWLLAGNLITLNKNHPLRNRITPGTGIIPLGFKFIDGNGYGIYEIGLNAVKRSFFAKRKNGSEDGILLRNRLFLCNENDVLDMKQVYGGGSLNCFFYFIVAGNSRQLGAQDYVLFEETD